MFCNFNRQVQSKENIQAPVEVAIRIASVAMKLYLMYEDALNLYITRITKKYDDFSIN